MKVNKFNNELKQQTPAQLTELLQQLRQKLFSLRLSSQTAHVKDSAQFEKLRKDIARVLTFMKKHEQQAQSKN